MSRLWNTTIRIDASCNGAGFDIIKSENLCTFNGERSYSLGQGQ